MSAFALRGRGFQYCRFIVFIALPFMVVPFLASAQDQAGESPAPAQTDTSKAPAKPVTPAQVQAAPEKPVASNPAVDTAAGTIEEIVVTASRTNSTLQKTTGAATVVTNKTIETMSRGVAADEALGLVPGVRIDNQADGERLHMSIRGQGILSEHGLRGIKVLLDGISLNDPTGFVSDLYDIDWETVDRIEVLRGPAAALYGCASNAGVINIITQKGGDKPVGGSVYESNGSNGFWKTLGQLNGTKDNSSYRLSYSHTQGDGSRQHQVYWGDIASLKEVWTPSDKVTITPIVNFSNYFNDNSEGISLDTLNSPGGYQKPNSDAIPFNEYMKTTKLTGGVVVKAAIADNQSLDVTGFLRAASYRESNNHYFDIQTILTPGGSLQYNWDAKCSGFTNHLTIGSDLENQTINETELPHINDVTRTEGKGDWTEDVIIPKDSVLADQTITQSGIGVFLQEQVDIDKLTIMGNLRYDNVENELTDMMIPSDSVTKAASRLSMEKNFEKVTGRIGASYSVMEALNFYGSWGLGFLPPATDELLSNPQQFGGFNKDMKASQSNGEELGVRGSVGKSAFYELTGFLLNTQNDFYRYRLASRPQETFYANGGDSKRLGAEAFISYSPVKPLCIQLAYTYSDFEYMSSTYSDSTDNKSVPQNGQFLPNSPKHVLNAQIDYRFLDNFTIEASTEYSSLWYIYTDAQNAGITQDGYVLFNARLGYDWKIGLLKGNISFSVKNIADKAWIAFTEPDLGDNGEPNNSYQPGPGREFFGGLRIKF